MKLADLRKFTVRRQSQIRFRMRNGLECVISERGIAQVPSWKGIPDFNLEEELAAAGEFVLEPAASEGKKGTPKPQSIGREELSRLTSDAPSASAAVEHEEE